MVESFTFWYLHTDKMLVRYNYQLSKGHQLTTVPFTGRLRLPCVCDFSAFVSVDKSSCAALTAEAEKFRSQIRTNRAASRQLLPVFLIALSICWNISIRDLNLDLVLFFLSLSLFLICILVLALKSWLEVIFSISLFLLSLTLLNLPRNKWQLEYKDPDLQYFNYLGYWGCVFPQAGLYLLWNEIHLCIFVLIKSSRRHSFSSLTLYPRNGSHKSVPQRVNTL